jgi:hypothetical protein
MMSLTVSDSISGSFRAKLDKIENGKSNEQSLTGRLKWFTFEGERGMSNGDEMKKDE